MANRAIRHITGATTRELRGLLARREGRIRELEVEIEQVAEEARRNSSTVGQREGRIRELEVEIEQVAEEARVNSNTAGQREGRIRELEIRIEQVAEEARVNSNTVGQREGRIRELEIEIEEVAEQVRVNSVTVGQREGRIRELEIEIEQVAEEARVNSNTVGQREGRIRELEMEIEQVAEEARVHLIDRECRVRELEEQLEALNNFAPPWLPTASPKERALIAWEATSGWCTKEKAEWLTALTIERRVANVLEIGVFGGKSFLPVAAAMTCWGGVAYGVEPWSSELSIAEPTGIRNDFWWASVDMRIVKSNFYFAVARLGLASQVRMIELPSDQAKRVLTEQRFGLIHIDGSHAPGQSLRDVEQWSPLLTPGGVLVLDDIDWPSVAKARAFVEERFKLIETRRDAQGSYAAYVKRPE